MILTLTTTGADAQALGWLLHKHPDRAQRFDLSFGHAHVFYPESAPERCTAALVLDVNPLKLSRRPVGERGMPLLPYVNDRPYTASSFLSVALGRVYGTAMSGTCKARPELVEQELEITAQLAALPCRGGEPVVRALFEPLGYTVEATPHMLDEAHPEWGNARLMSVTLHTRATLRAVLEHLYVLIPVLDDAKHYYVGQDEVDKLLRRGGDWLAAHPAHALITRRYLEGRRALVRAALEELHAEHADADPEVDQARDEDERALEKPLSLHDRRLDQVAALLASTGARAVVDMGCGEGRLLERLLKQRQFETILGVDVSARALQIAERRLRFDRMPERKRARITLRHGSLVYRDVALQGFDAAALVEVIEHLDATRLAALERVVFQHAAPHHVIVTTPNVEYNALFETLPAGSMRHRDHRFEWTRAEFEAWANEVATTHGYAVTFAPVGDIHPEHGAPCQLAHFTRSTGEVR